MALVYDVKQPADSLQMLALLNPYGQWFRDIHYGSAQLFLITFFIHLFEYIFKNGSQKVSWGIWLRLSFSIVFIFFVMLSGFMLKADEDAMLAVRILSGLIGTIPGGNDFLAYSIIGKQGDLQILYMHHLATTTIFIFLIIIEHARRIWPTSGSFAWALLLSIVAVYIIPAHSILPADLAHKGPWYFVGLQEVLHWLSHPGLFWWIVLAGFLPIVFLPKIKQTAQIYFRWTIYAIFIIYIFLTIIGWYFRGVNWQWVYPW